MSKNHDSKKDSKKKPARTIMEKRAAKREKRNDNQGPGLFDTNRPGAGSIGTGATKPPKHGGR